MNIKDQLNAIYSDQYKSYIETDSLILGQYAALSLPDLNNNLKQIDAVDIAYDLVPVYFKKNTLKYDLLEKSILAGEILKFKEELEFKNITIEQAMLAICSFYNLYKENNYYKVPDRFLARRLQISTSKIQSIFYILNKSNIIDIKIVDGDIWTKLNNNLLEKDEYFKYRCTKSLKRDKKVLKNIGPYGIYSSELTDNYFFKHLRETILGITIAYNNLIGKTFNSDRRNQDLAMYGERTDIKYLEIPIHIIIRETKLPEKYIRYYIKQLLDNADYAAKRDRVYQSNIYDSTYYWENYKSASLVDYKEAKKDDDRLLVTENSIILFVDNFNRTHTGQNVNKNLDYYTKVVVHSLQQVLDQNILIEEDYQKVNYIVKDYLERSMIDRLIENSESNFSKEDLKKYNKEKSQLIDPNKLKLRNRGSKDFGGHKIKVNFTKLNIDKAIKALSLALFQLESLDIPKRQIKYNDKLITKLITYIKDKLDTIKQSSLVLFKHYEKYLYSLNLGLLLA